LDAIRKLRFFARKRDGSAGMRALAWLAAKGGGNHRFDLHCLGEALGRSRQEANPAECLTRARNYSNEVRRLKKAAERHIALSSRSYFFWGDPLGLALHHYPGLCFVAVVLSLISSGPHTARILRALLDRR